MTDYQVCWYCQKYRIAGLLITDRQWPVNGMLCMKCAMRTPIRVVVLWFSLDYLRRETG